VEAEEEMVLFELERVKGWLGYGRTAGSTWQAGFCLTWVLVAALQAMSEGGGGVWCKGVRLWLVAASVQVICK